MDCKGSNNHISLRMDLCVVQTDNNTARDIFQAPATVYYIPNFVSDEEEEVLLEHVFNAPKPKWEFLSHRRLQNWGGILGKKGSLIQNHDIPVWLKVYMEKIGSIPGVFPEDRKPNHVLVNEYLPGQGIMAHEDGPAFFPTVTTISLGSHTLLDFYRHNNSHGENQGDQESLNNVEKKPFGCMLLERRSLVIIKDEMYEKYMHGIGERKEDVILEGKIFNGDRCVGDFAGGCRVDRGTRISITIRNVPKVAKFSVQSLLMNR